ncbi:putative alpha-latrocrustotoxin-Lt1a-like [Abeliophyllum distichum]|uniref:Alpha-latrocrustotoxin-Lt1a-like n=1 Tax=Abeliophyllum distichum TaxID=126358 RepID=A0ABD1NP12_9LAMI
MIGFIERQGLMSFILGTVPAPPQKITIPDDNSSSGTKEIENPDYPAWRSSDELVREWIFKTLEEDILIRVRDLETAKDVWRALRKDLGQTFQYPGGNGLPAKLEELHSQNHSGDIENPTICISVKDKVHAVFWRGAAKIVPLIKDVQEKKKKHYQALQLVKCLCSEIVKLDYSKANALLEPPLKLAIRFGIYEVVEEILVSFPSAVYHESEKIQTLLHQAVVNRRENVFNLIHQFESKHIFLSAPDATRNNGLHLAGYLEPQQKFNLRAKAAGAALQAQRELQWFKEVEKYVLPQHRDHENTQRRTPRMAFTETHEELIKEGEQWMKDTANSCTIVAALVATVVFASAITVPGGNNGNSGRPIFYDEMAFIIFGISDAVALFASTSSVLKACMVSLMAPFKHLPWIPAYLILRTGKKSDSLVKGWILSTLEDDDLRHMAYYKTAEQVWCELKKLFGHPFIDFPETELNDEAGKNLSRYLPLHKAALSGDWEKAKSFIEREEPQAFRAIITGFSETALIVSASSVQRNYFSKKLVELMSPEDLAIKGRLGLTALHVAAAVGNAELTKLLVDKNPDLPNIRDNADFLALHLAAGNVQRNTVTYLLTVTKEDVEPKPFEDKSGVDLIHFFLLSDFYGKHNQLSMNNSRILEMQIYGYLRK